MSISTPSDSGHLSPSPSIGKLIDQPYLFSLQPLSNPLFSFSALTSTRFSPVSLTLIFSSLAVASPFPIFSQITLASGKPHQRFSQKPHLSVRFSLSMDNFLPPFQTQKKASSSFFTNISDAADPFTPAQSQMTVPQISTAQYHCPTDFPSTLEDPQFNQSFAAYIFSSKTQPQSPFDLQEKKLLDAWSTKIARNKRRMARQRSLSLSKASSPVTSFSGENNPKGSTASVGADSYVQNSTTNINTNSYTFYTPDKKRLRVMLKKELKNSDVGSLGRIVLPKKEAEENLPALSDKEGIQIVIRDVYSYQVWHMKFKYWSNNRSRMYVLENTGDFVRQNGLGIGDSITLYEDECKNLYISIKKAQSPGSESSYKQDKNNFLNDNICTPACVKDEEEAALALLIEELKQTERVEEASNPMAMSREGNTQPTMPVNSSSSSWSRINGIDDYHVSLEDCYGGLEILPEVSGYKYPLFYHDPCPF